MFPLGIRQEVNSISNMKDGLFAGCNKTTFTWTVGRFRRLGMGECVSKTVKAGKTQQWRVSFYPKGFSDPENVSFFVTNVGLEGGEDTIVKACITISVKIPEATAKSATGKNKQKPKSTTKPNQKDSKEPPVLRKRLNKTFTVVDHTFGFDNFAAQDCLFSLKNGLVWDVPGNDSANTISGKISFQVDIHEFGALQLDPPELFAEVDAKGWQRVEWVLKDVQGLIQKVGPGQLLASDDFKANGQWYLNLYPNGYRVEGGGCMSVYLHLARQQVERGVFLKRKIRFGIKRANPLGQELYERLGECPDGDAFYPPNSSLTAIFSSAQKTAGKQLFLPHSLLQKGRTLQNVNSKELGTDARALLQQEFVAGKYSSAGAVTLVLDILVSDMEEGQVQQMLHMTPSFQNDAFGVCGATGRKFGIAPLFGGASGKPYPCYMCGRQVSVDLLQVDPCSRLPEFGYEIGRDGIMDVLLREAGSVDWLRLPLKELRLSVRDWVARTVANSKPLRDLRHGMHTVEERLRVVEAKLRAAARPGLLCEGEAPSDSEEDEDSKPVVCRREMIRNEREMHLQRQAQERLSLLRQRVEDAHFAKPVCSFCLEACRFKVELPTVTSELNSGYGLHGASKRPLSAGWRKMLALAESELREPQSNPRHANASTLARGGFYSEPLELHRQCSGRCNKHDPWDEEGELDSFCDVRFDRRQSLLVGVPKKHVCHATGRVMCANCVRFKATLPEHERDPLAPTPVPVSQQVWQERQVPSGRINLVSDKSHLRDEVTSRKKNLKDLDADAGNESDDDDDESGWGYVKSLFQGPNLLEGKWLLPSLPGAPAS